MSVNYWDGVANHKNFYHPFDGDLFAKYTDPTGRVIDVGCGYGRVLAELISNGYTNSFGVDSSSRMVARGKREHPDLDIRLANGIAIGEPPSSVHAIVLFAVLTSLPDAEDQRLLVKECERLLEPGGVVYVSDLYLNRDARNEERYARGEAEFGVRGVFRLEDGGVMRHHSESWVESLFTGFDRAHHRKLSVTTMNGNSANAFQLIARKPSDTSA